MSNPSNTAECDYPKIERLTDIKRPFHRDITKYDLYKTTDLSHIAFYCGNISTLYETTLMQLYMTIEYLCHAYKDGIIKGGNSGSKIVVSVIDSQFVTILKKLFSNVEFVVLTVKDDISSYIQSDVTLISLHPLVSKKLYEMSQKGDLTNTNYMLILDIESLEDSEFSLPSISVRGILYDSRGSKKMCLWCKHGESNVTFNKREWHNKLVYFNSFHRWDLFIHNKSNDLIPLVKYYEPVYDRVSEYSILLDFLKDSSMGINDNVDSIGGDGNSNGDDDSNGNRNGNGNRDGNINVLSKLINSIQRHVEKVCKCTYPQKLYVSYYNCMKMNKEANISLFVGIKLLLRQEVMINNYITGEDNDYGTFTEMYFKEGSLSSSALPVNFKDDFKEVVNALITTILEKIKPSLGL